MYVFFKQDAFFVEMFNAKVERNYNIYSAEYILFVSDKIIFHDQELYLI